MGYFVQKVLLGRFVSRGLIRKFVMGDTPMDISAWRANYANKEEPFLLEENLCSKIPNKIFDKWFRSIAAVRDASFEEVNAVCISTVSKDNRPSSRMVLLKSFDEQGFVFYTNKESRKAEEFLENSNVALLFYWPRVHRQIRVEGRIEELSEESAATYWNSRPLASRIGSKASKQSQHIPNRQFLLEKKKELENLAEKDGPSSITRPPTWCGFRVVPRYFEFWQGQSDRLHDRIVFNRDVVEGAQKTDEGWFMYRLSP